MEWSVGVCGLFVLGGLFFVCCGVAFFCLVGLGLGFLVLFFVCVWFVFVLFFVGGCVGFVWLVWWFGFFGLEDLLSKPCEVCYRADYFQEPKVDLLHRNMSSWILECHASLTVFTQLFFNFFT